MFYKKNNFILNICLVLINLFKLSVFKKKHHGNFKLYQVTFVKSEHLQNFNKFSTSNIQHTKYNKYYF